MEENTESKDSMPKDFVISVRERKKGVTIPPPDAGSGERLQVGGIEIQIIWMSMIWGWMSMSLAVDAVPSRVTKVEISRRHQVMLEIP